MNNDIVYVRPCVMRYFTSGGGTVYTVHDVYFDEHHNVVTYTENALSPRENTVEQLKESLLEIIARGGTIACGDLGYEYEIEDLDAWLRNINLPPIDYVD